eukprot:TRINITY_DN1817_c4_g1_i2.p1 TRINITY_DN1817_c4_g1~~TRINITY_DN1817_c4_g1_i2.p1  ORF type:complete len:255 (+),score=84.07 TRINITY_DN1817_c4_g1_i2:57-821(+)
MQRAQRRLLAAGGAKWVGRPQRRFITERARRYVAQVSESARAQRVKETEEVLECIEMMGEDPETGKMLAERLSCAARREILEVCERAAKGGRAAADREPEVAPPTTRQMFRLAFLAGLPMVGFGFMDNAIMILAGDYIDTYLCVSIGLSTLFAAALGNILSDVAGVATAGPIESFMRNLGIKGHGMTPSQLRLQRVLTVKYLGSAVGVFVGCVLGMFPLLWPKEYRLWPTKKDVLVLQDDADHDLDLAPDTRTC